MLVRLDALQIAIRIGDDFALTRLKVLSTDNANRMVGMFLFLTFSTRSPYRWSEAMMIHGEKGSILFFRLT